MARFARHIAPFVALWIAGGLVAICAACGESTNTTNLVHSEHISKTTFKGIWPVSVDGGTLTCDATKGGAITFTPDGSNDTYASNGTAMGWAPKEGWKDFRDIWLDDPDGLGPKVNSRDFDAEAQKLCTMNRT
jgi:hypothetical protein